MSIDEAIAHARKVANEKYTEGMLCHANPNDEELDGCIECAREHEQLAEWLEELQMYKSLSPRELISEKQKNDRAIEYSKGFNYGFKTGYNKAIDDIKEKLMQNGFIYTQHALDVFNEIEEQLKEGEKNDNLRR